MRLLMVLPRLAPRILMQRAQVLRLLNVSALDRKIQTDRGNTLTVTSGLPARWESLRCSRACWIGRLRMPLANFGRGLTLPLFRVQVFDPLLGSLQ